MHATRVSQATHLFFQKSDAGFTSCKCLSDLVTHTLQAAALTCKPSDVHTEMAVEVDQAQAHLALGAQLVCDSCAVRRLRDNQVSDGCISGSAGAPHILHIMSGNRACLIGAQTGLNAVPLVRAAGPPAGAARSHPGCPCSN